MNNIKYELLVQSHTSLFIHIHNHKFLRPFVHILLLLRKKEKEYNKNLLSHITLFGSFGYIFCVRNLLNKVNFEWWTDFILCDGRLQGSCRVA